MKVITIESEPVEEWIWVTGYKGTDKDMKCRDRQFELNKRFDISEEKAVELCSHGFHLCRTLSSVFRHYFIDNSNRFFEVKALVKKKDYDRGENDDLAAKSIIFTRELAEYEILKAWFIFNTVV